MNKKNKNDGIFWDISHEMESHVSILPFLTLREKSEMRSRLIEFMKANPLRSSVLEEKVFDGE